MKIGIVIPCYNVAGSVRQVLESLTAPSLKEIAQVIAIDNKSSDRTLTELRSVQGGSSPVAAKLTIFANKENYGLGGSQKIGYDYFLKNDFSHFMILHGDAQGDSNLIIARFLAALTNDPAIDLIFASRFRRDANLRGYNLSRRLGNIAFNWITALFTGHFMTDAGTGIIFYRTEILRQIDYGALKNECQFNPELNILLRNIKGIKISEVPLDWKDSPEVSSIKVFSYAWVLLRLLVGYRIAYSLCGKKDWQAFHRIPNRIEARYEVI